MRCVRELVPIETPGDAPDTTVENDRGSDTKSFSWGVAMKLIMVAAVTVGLMTVLALGAAVVYVLIFNASQRSL